MKIRVLSWLKHQFATHRTAWVAVLMLGVGFGARDVWRWATTPDEYEALLYYDDPERPALSPELDYFGLDEKEQYDPWDAGRYEMAWVAMERLYGLRGIISSPAWNCAIYDYIGSRKTMTRNQISRNEPEFLPVYQRLESALDRFAEVNSDHAAEKLNTLAAANDAKLLARIVQYQIVKGGSGGDAEFDASKMGALFDRQYACVRAKENNDKEAIARNAVMRANYIKAASDVANELKNWNPKCARLVVIAMNRYIEPFPSDE